jgi:hypothetical protein
LLQIFRHLRLFGIINEGIIVLRLHLLQLDFTYKFSPISVHREFRSNA